MATYGAIQKTNWQEKVGVAEKQTETKTGNGTSPMCTFVLENRKQAVHKDRGNECRNLATLSTCIFELMLLLLTMAMTDKNKNWDLCFIGQKNNKE